MSQLSILSVLLVLTIKVLFPFRIYSQENYLHIDSIHQESRDEYLKFRESLKQYIYILEDSSRELTIEEISSSAFNDAFIPFTTFSNLKENTTYWARLNINLDNSDSTTLLISPASSDYFEFYIPDENGYELIKTGDLLASSQNSELYFGSNLILIKLKANLQQTGNLTSVYVRFYNYYIEKPGLRFDIFDQEDGFWHMMDRMKRNIRTSYINGISYGILGLIFLISLVLFLSQKNREYLFYSMYVLFISFFITLGGGVLLKNLREYDFLIQISSAFTALFFYVRFLKNVVNFKEISPLLKRIIASINILYPVMLSIVIVFLVILKISGQIFNIAIIPLTAIYMLPILYFNIILLGSKIFLNKIFSIGSLILFAAFLYTLLVVALDFPDWFDWLIVIRMAIIAQVITFAYLLIYKMRQNEKLKIETQEKLLIQLKENEELQTKVNRELEQKVKERTEEIVQQKEEIESQRDNLELQRDLLIEQKKEITDSINYAKRIQTAILPDNELLHELLPKHFVLFKPRDVVSGDFYWIKQIKNFTLVVAADCTGHGVPGAFMSMLGVALLNEITGKSRLDTAGEILDRLRHKLKTTLSQEGKDQEQKDGMDIALAIVDNESNELQFAGAFNPIYIIRQSNKDKKLAEHFSIEEKGYSLFEIKGDKQPIAIYMNEKNFTTNYVNLQSGDALYMFSDGYPDQIGGTNGKKLMVKKFKELLLSIQGIDMSSQKETLNKAIEAWKQDLDQIDDILVFGIKV